MAIRKVKSETLSAGSFLITQPDDLKNPHHGMGGSGIVSELRHSAVIVARELPQKNTVISGANR